PTAQHAAHSARLRVSHTPAPHQHGNAAPDGAILSAHDLAAVAGQHLTVGATLDAAREIAFFFQAEDGIRDLTVTGVQTFALPISSLRSADVRWREYLRAGCRERQRYPPPSPPRSCLSPCRRRAASRHSRSRPSTRRPAPFRFSSSTRTHVHRGRGAQLRSRCRTQSARRSLRPSGTSAGLRHRPEEPLSGSQAGTCPPSLQPTRRQTVWERDRRGYPSSLSA